MLRRRLEKEKAELAAMMENGGRGSVVGSKVEIKGYKDNLRKREGAAKRRTSMKVALAEAKALGGKEGVEAAKSR